MAKETECQEKGTKYQETWFKVIPQMNALAIKGVLNHEILQHEHYGKPSHNNIWLRDYLLQELSMRLMQMTKSEMEEYNKFSDDVEMRDIEFVKKPKGEDQD